jgi:hypothetical protein
MPSTIVRSDVNGRYIIIINGINHRIEIGRPGGEEIVWYRSQLPHVGEPSELRAY